RQKNGFRSPWRSSSRSDQIATMAQDRDSGDMRRFEAERDGLEGERPLFGYAPPNGVETWIALTSLHRLETGRRAVLFVLIGWAPLIVLALLQGALAGTGDAASILREAGVHARYLIAVPFLVLADAVCAPQLDAIKRHLVESGIVPEHARGRLR